MNKNTNYEYAEKILLQLKDMERFGKDNTSKCRSLHAERREANAKLTAEEKAKLFELEMELNRKYFTQSQTKVS